MRELTTADARCTLLADKGLWGTQDTEMLTLQELFGSIPGRLVRRLHLCSRVRAG